MGKKSGLAAPFAHFFGLNKKAEEEEDPKDPKAEDEGGDEDPDRKRREDETDEEYAARMKSLESEDDDESAESEEDSEGDDKEKAIVQKERARCAKILAKGFEMDRSKMAASLACDTNVTAEAAISIMKAAAIDAPKARGNLNERMSQERLPNPGVDNVENQPAAGTPQATTNFILESARKARGEK